MLIGIDFDNTIVSYDEIFSTVAKELGYIPSRISMGKTQLRDRLRGEGREQAWTEMQGYVYGERMRDASTFPGVIEFFSCARESGIPVVIISHRSRYPYMGPRYDLHATAKKWLHENIFTVPEQMLLTEDQVFFELSKEDKMNRIIQQKCTHFIDDLPEFLLEPRFPTTVHKILFDPDGCHERIPNLYRVSSWKEIRAMVSDISTCLNNARRSGN